MSTFLSFQKLGNNRNTPRIWIENLRLNHLGFPAGTNFEVTYKNSRVTLKRNPENIVEKSDRKNKAGSKRIVSHRRAAGGLRPIIELCSKELIDSLGEIEIVKTKSSYGLIEISPSLRSFLIGKSQNTKAPFKTLEIFAGGGTLSEALRGNSLFSMQAGVEIDPIFADAWGQRHPNATIIQSDIRLMHPSEFPKFDVLIGGIPCTSHSTLGRAKKGLAGRPEEGDTGDLFIHVIQLVSHHMPKACVFENVPSFGTSLAGSLLRTSLQHLGYQIEESILEPHKEWGEPSDRKRWVMVATLNKNIGTFELKVPHLSPIENISDFLDEIDDVQDQIDSEKISNTIEGLRRHNARHKELGHGFAMSTINRESKKIPTIPKSYHKINTGPFVETPFGLRMLRTREIERIMGSPSYSNHYATSVQILGQGVQTRVWREILSQVGRFLEHGSQKIEKNHVSNNTELPTYESTALANTPQQSVTNQSITNQSITNQSMTHQSLSPQADKKSIPQLELFLEIPH
jgi:DNA (cytosine-5)-methyltransferase 1